MLYLDGARAVALGSAILADVEQRPARLSRRNRRMGKLAIVAIVAATLGLAAVPFTNHAERATPVVLAYGAFMSWLVLTACWFGWYRASVEESVVEVREHEGAPRLHAGGVPLRAYRKGAAARLPDGTARVELRAGLDALRVHLPSLEQARALLGALGLDRRVGSSTFRVRTFVQTRFLTLFSVVTGCFAYVSLVVGLTPAVLVSLALPLVIWTALALRSVRSLTVGADGLELRGLMHRSFVPHASIRRVCRVDSRGRPLEESDRSVSPGFSVELTSGRRLLVDSRIERFEANAWQGDAIHDAVFLAWSRARDQPAAAAAFLARGGRTTREWLAALRAGTQSAG